MKNKIDDDGKFDLDLVFATHFWYRKDGKPMTQQDWEKSINSAKTMQAIFDADTSSPDKTIDQAFSSIKHLSTLDLAMIFLSSEGEGAVYVNHDEGLVKDFELGIYPIEEWAALKLTDPKEINRNLCIAIIEEMKIKQKQFDDFKEEVGIEQFKHAIVKLYRDKLAEEK